MSKSVRITLNENQVDQLMRWFGSEFLRIGDEDAEDTKWGKAVIKLHDDIVKAQNRQHGIWYLWQLKDRDGEVTKDNILKEWGGNAVE